MIDGRLRRRKVPHSVSRTAFSGVHIWGFPPARDCAKLCEGSILDELYTFHLCALGPI